MHTWHAYNRRCHSTDSGVKWDDIFFFFSSLCYCCSGRVVPLHKICRSFVVLFCIVVVAGCSLQRGVSAAYPCRAAIHGFRCEEIVMHSLAVASYKNQDKCVYCLQTLMICKSNIIFVRSREMWCTTTSVRCAFAVTATHTHLRMGWINLLFHFQMEFASKFACVVSRCRHPDMTQLMRLKRVIYTSCTSG